MADAAGDREAGLVIDAGTQPVRSGIPVSAGEASTDERLAELAEYHKAAVKLILSRGLVKKEERDTLTGIRDRIEVQIEGLRLTEDAGEVPADVEDASVQPARSWRC